MPFHLQKRRNSSLVLQYNKTNIIHVCKLFTCFDQQNASFREPATSTLLTHSGERACNPPSILLLYSYWLSNDYQDAGHFLIGTSDTSVKVHGCAVAERPVVSRSDVSHSRSNVKIPRIFTTATPQFRRTFTEAAILQTHLAWRIFFPQTFSISKLSPFLSKIVSY